MFKRHHIAYRKNNPKALFPKCSIIALELQHYLISTIYLSSFARAHFPEYRLRGLRNVHQSPSEQERFGRAAEEHCLRNSYFEHQEGQVVAEEFQLILSLLVLVLLKLTFNINFNTFFSIEILEKQVLKQFDNFIMGQSQAPQLPTNIFVPSQNETYQLFINKYSKVFLNENVTAKEIHTAQIRIKNQLKEIEQDPPSLWKIVNSQQLNLWIILVEIDIDTPFHSTPFVITLEFPQNYPQKMPIIKVGEPHRFFHPNINSTNGYICEKTQRSAGALLRARDRVEIFINLLKYPNQNDPMNHEAASLIKKGQEHYFRRAFKIFHGYKDYQS